MEENQDQIEKLVKATINIQKAQYNTHKEIFSKKLKIKLISLSIFFLPVISVMFYVFNDLIFTIMFLFAYVFLTIASLNQYEQLLKTHKVDTSKGLELKFSTLPSKKSDKHSLITSDLIEKEENIINEPAKKMFEYHDTHNPKKNEHTTVKEKMPFTINDIFNLNKTEENSDLDE